ncbi:hypothetical protein HDU88_004373 [Geranomyces variabilis]|nr:hypothetical protein HDU88_004373 [Geranomyces variabilis]
MPTKGKHAKTKGRKQKPKQCNQAGHKQCNQAGFPFKLSNYRDQVERGIRRHPVNLARKILCNKNVPRTYDDFNMHVFLKTASRACQPNTVNNMTNKDVMQAYDADIRHGIKVDTEIPGDKIAVGLDAAGERLYVYFPSFAKFRNIHDDLDSEITTLITMYPPAQPDTDACHVEFPGQPDPHGTLHIGFWGQQTQPGPKETWTPQISGESFGKGSVFRNTALYTFLGSNAMHRITLFITLLFHLIDKDSYEANRAAFEKQHYAQKNFWSSNPFQVAFAMIVIVINEFVTKHRDLKDKGDGWCAVVCLGDFQGGKFCLPQLKTRIPFVPGDILFIRSCALEHMGQKGTGDHRYSVVFKMHDIVYK